MTSVKIGPLGVESADDAEQRSVVEHAAKSRHHHPGPIKEEDLAIVELGGGVSVRLLAPKNELAAYKSAIGEPIAVEFNQRPGEPFAMPDGVRKVVEAHESGR